MQPAAGLALCFTCSGEPITTEQQAAWGWSDAQLTEQARLASRDAITASRPLRQEVHDMPGRHYWLSASGDGLDMAAFLHPEALAAALGGEAPVVSVPGSGTLLVWLPGDQELDTVVAVGVKSMHGQAAWPVSDKIYRYQDGEWVVWGETRLSDPF
jgi:hypothetical protein